MQARTQAYKSLISLVATAAAIGSIIPMIAYLGQRSWGSGGLLHGFSQFVSKENGLAYMLWMSSPFWMALLATVFSIVRYHRPVVPADYIYVAEIVGLATLAVLAADLWAPLAVGADGGWAIGMGISPIIVTVAMFVGGAIVWIAKTILHNSSA